MEEEKLFYESVTISLFISFALNFWLYQLSSDEKEKEKSSLSSTSDSIQLILKLPSLNKRRKKEEKYF